MTTFERFIFIYLVSATALAGFAVLWRNWLEDHASWKTWLRVNLGVVSKMLTCGSCFTMWLTLFFVVIIHPLNGFSDGTPLADLPSGSYYLVQWMSLGWSALFLRFLYIATQEIVSILVHRHKDHGH